MGTPQCQGIIVLQTARLGRSTKTMKEKSRNLAFAGILLLVWLIDPLSATCRTLDFKTVVKGKSLANHTIRTIEPIKDEQTCRTQCYLEQLCFAVNFCQKNGIEAVCELLNNTATVIHDEDLIDKQECTIYKAESSCSSYPCPSNASCLGDFLTDPVPYRCICPSGFSGKFCESDIDECALNIHHCPPKLTKCTNLIGSHNCTCKFGYQGDGKKCNDVPANCSGVFSFGYTADGVYEIDPDGQGSFPVYCDMTTDGRAWTVFQRNRRGFSFNHSWEDYKTGFGNQISEFWLGLDKIYRLTKSQVASLRVDLEDMNGIKKYAEYSSFSIADESDFYRLHASGYSGTAGDSLTTSTTSNLKWISNKMSFTTRDKDNDLWSRGVCAVENSGGWWFGWCSISDLNGKMSWWTFTKTLKNTEMKLE